MLVLFKVEGQGEAVVTRVRPHNVPIVIHVLRKLLLLPFRAALQSRRERTE
jgi:hypothetical protein